MKTRLQKICWTPLAVGLTFVAACGDNTAIKVTAPAVVQGGAPLKALPPLEASVVDAPIEYQVAPILRALNSAVPLKFGDIKQRIQSTSNKR
ncbi:MAG: hypothetical protein ABJC26_03315, partial [Gemmatimonadaceae bacterium]